MNFTKPAILWDLDGTIIDSTECHYKSWAAVLEKRGYTLSYKTFKAHYGKNTKTALPFYLGFDPEPDLEESIKMEKETLFRQLVTNEATLVPGVASWLESARNAGWKQAIASSAGMKNIATMLSAYNLIGHFDLLVSGANLPAKPRPDVFLTAAELLHQLPENCLVIEDSIAGIEAAKKAGMICIAVATSHDRSQLESADLILNDFNVPFFDTLDHIRMNHHPSSDLIK